MALAEYGLNADVSLPSLNPIVEIAVKIFDVPASAVNMIGSDQVFFAASAGIDECDMRRDVSFCAHAITQDGVMVVEDAALDPRFHDNPLVTEGLIRFYAGVPLLSPSGHALGALCVVDSKPHSHFDEQDRARLKDLASMAADKLELRRLEVANRAKPSRFEASAAKSPKAVISFDQAEQITAWNDAAERIFGYECAEVIGKPLAMLLPIRNGAWVKAAIRRLSRGDPRSASRNNLLGVRKDGSEFPAEFSWEQWRQDGAPHFAAIVQEVRNQRPDQDTLYRLMNYDSLTGLPNRKLLLARATAALETEQVPSVIMIDLDRFKDINDTLGHAAGDGVLRQVAERLEQCVGPSDTVARVGGDEFAILLLGTDDPLRVSAIAEAAAAAIANPIIVDGHEVRVGASRGLAIAPMHGDNAEDLVANSDLALFQAKTGGPGRSFLYVPALRAEAAARRMYDSELHRALERNELLLYYQPQIRLADGALVGAEALLRWQHPVRNLVQPDAFIPALEGSSLAADVGNWALETACAQAAEWREVSPEFRMGVNLFGAQFHAGDLVPTIQRILTSHALPAEALELEITENIVVDRQDVVLPQLHAVRALGVELAFDDFGTGYASLNALQSYPVTHIKIDKGFLQAIQDDGRDRAIVTSLLELSHRLGFKVIAEGVETEAQCLFLRRHNCDEAQGYLFGRPMPAPLFAEKFGLIDQCSPVPALGRSSFHAH